MVMACAGPEKEAPLKPAFSQEIKTGWTFGLGKPEHGLRVDYEQKPKTDTLVSLPHRINRPNWPFWYEQTFHFPEDVYLFANGDDGVQCFLNGELQEPILGEYFQIPAAMDSTVVTLRVLNNAMKGGLRQVALIQPEDFDQYLRERDLQRLRQQLRFLAKRHAADLEETQRKAIKEALQDTASTQIRALIDNFPALKMPLLDARLQLQSNQSAFSFTAWGDSQGGWDTFAKLVPHMAAWPDSFSIGLGDLVAHGIDETQWLSFTQCLQPLLDRQLIFPIVGNHDYDGYYNDLDPLLYKHYVLGDSTQNTYLWWTYQGAYFLALDPNETFPLGIEGAQRTWLDDRLNSPEWQSANWRFILIHQPPYSQGWPDYHGDDFIREIVDSLAETRQIDFVLSGHSHDYERLTKTYGNQQTHFFILGGAGGGLEPPQSSDFPEMDTIIKKHHYARFEVAPERVTVSVYGLENELLDRWQGEKK